MDASGSIIIAALSPILLGATVLIVLRILPLPRGPMTQDGARLVLEFIGWALLVAGVIVGLAVGAGVLPGILAIVVAMMVFERNRRSAQQSLLWTLAVAAERNMPLGPAIRAFAEERRGAFGHRVWRMAQFVEAGWSIPDACELVSGSLPWQTVIRPQALLMIRVGQETGMLAAGLRAAATAGSNTVDSFWGTVAGKAWYLLVVFLFAMNILVFMMIKIVPQFEKIFKDFGADLPQMTKLVISFAYIFVNYWYLAFPLVAPIGLYVLYAAFRFIGWVQVDFPGTGWLARRLDIATILDSLSMTLQAQRPMLATVDALARFYPKPGIRARLRRSAADMHAGNDWIESLSRERLLMPAEAGVLRAAQRVGNLTWALSEMADSCRRRLAHRVYLLVQWLFPAVVLMYGLVVMVIATGLFLPLIALVTGLAERV